MQRKSNIPNDAPSQRREVLLALAAILTGLVLLGLTAIPGVYDALIDLTGETDAAQQVAALLRNRVRPALDTRDLVPLAHSGLCPYGVNTFFEQEVEERKLRWSMEMLRDTGVRWVRQQMPWYDIEPVAKGLYEYESGRSTWDKYDRIVALTQEYGLNIVARLDAPPNWSRADNSVYNRPPDKLADYGDFVHAFVSRYKGRIKYYQIWNEPNIYPEWGSRPVDAAGYVELLKVAYTRAKEADPEAVILSAGLAPTLGTDDDLNESDLIFLQKMYDAEAKNYFDIMSVMGYGLWTGPGDRRAEDGQVNFSRPQLIREIMVRNGDENKPIWLVEVGWNALPEDFPGVATHGRVSEDLQARYTIGAYQRAQEEWPWAGMLFYWHFRMVSDESRDQVVFYFRMADPDFTQQPVYRAYQEMATSPPALGYGLHQEDHWALDYQGEWETVHDEEAVLGAYRRSSAADDGLVFRFRGRNLSLITAFGPQWGQLCAEIDGAPANAVPRDENGMACLELSASESVWQVRVPLAVRLPDGEHEVRLRSRHGEATIDGFVVDREQECGGQPFLAAALLLGVALAGLVRRRRRDA